MYNSRRGIVGEKKKKKNPPLSRTEMLLHKYLVHYEVQLRDCRQVWVWGSITRQSALYIMLLLYLKFTIALRRGASLLRLVKLDKSNISFFTVH